MNLKTILKALAFSVAVTGGAELRAAPTTTMVGDGELVISFTEVGSHTWVAPTDISDATVLIVGGGGGGAGGVSAGGGGAGQVILASNQVFTAGASYALAVGAGGAGGANKNPGAKGAASSFGGWTADGGGAGDISEAKAAETGANGGGDGAKSGSVPVPGTGETKVDGSVYFYGGHAGGASLRSLWAGGGGGGAQGDGASATTLGVGGTGGDGLPLDITGEKVFYACGGGGGINGQTDVTPGKGGSEGVSGGSALLTGGEAGRANTGTGGGGGSFAGTAQPGGAGGSGIVVIRYKSPTAYAVVTGYEGLLDGTAHGATIAGLYPSEGATVWYAADADAAWTTEPIAFGTKGTHTIRVKITAEGLKDFETSVTVSLTDEPGVTDGSVCLVAPAGDSTPTAPYATWATAANDLATALDAVNEGGMVYVAPGTYALSQALSVTKALTLRGFDRETGADDPEKVVLDGQNACRVLSAYVGAVAPIFRGLTFARGKSKTDVGGGVFLQGVAGASVPQAPGEAPSFVNCVFTNCTATEQGAALHVQGRVFVQGCRFVGNVTASGNYGNTVSVRTLSGKADAGAAAAFIDCTFTEDATAIPANASTLALRGYGNLVSNCVFTTCGSANRGVIVSDSTSVSAANTIIANCICRDAGASFVAPIEGNSYGGAAIRNCLVVGGKGYGIVTGTGRTEIDNCTITGQRLAGIQVKGECVVRNTIAWNNTKADLELGAGAVYSEVTSSTGWDGAAAGVNAVNPVFRNAAAGDYSLKRRTPHLDKGTVLDWMTTGTTDLAGRPRVATNGRPLSVDADAKPDLGCYENQEIRKGLCVLIR